MSLDLVNYKQEISKAIKMFWERREAAKNKQSQKGKADQGERSSVTAGKHLDGFVTLITKLIQANGLADADI